MTRSKSATPATPRQAKLSPAQIREAIPRIELRIADLEALPVVTSGSDPRLKALEHAINATLADIFGTESLEYDRMKDPFTGTTWAAAFLVGGADQNRGPPAHEIQQRVERERQESLALLRSQVGLLKEQVGDGGGSPADRALRAYASLDLHPEIARAASGLYRDGHYANAVEDAVKALNAWVRLRSGVELDGTSLMQKVFSPNTPVLRFNDLLDLSDRDEQQGFMMMFSGAVAGLRNPRAHKIIKDDPERALEFIAFVSLLAKLVDEAKRTP
jgi:uncharacterized protein (TIGR02391 family)